MPSSFCLPPVGCWRGTNPTQAAKSRPFRKAAPLPIAATSAVAVSGPTPGICPSVDRLHFSHAVFLISVSTSSRRITNWSSCIFSCASMQPYCARQLHGGVFQNPRQRCLQMAPSFAQSDATFEQQSTNLVDDRCNQQVADQFVFRACAPSTVFRA